MNNYALSIANEIIDLANKDGVNINLLKLMKLCYISHGFMLSALDRPTEGAKRDKVEAWTKGPVFRVVYDSFKHVVGPITQKDKELDFDGGTEAYEPQLTDPMEKKLCKFVWENYKDWSAEDLVRILHKAGSPWSQFYKPHMNVVIPDSVTKEYYTKFIQIILEENNVSS